MNHYAWELFIMRNLLLFQKIAFLIMCNFPHSLKGVGGFLSKYWILKLRIIEAQTVDSNFYKKSVYKNECHTNTLAFIKMITDKMIQMNLVFVRSLFIALRIFPLLEKERPLSSLVKLCWRWIWLNKYHHIEIWN